MLSNYTYEGCTFECRLKNAFEAIGCIPWGYPIPPYLEANQTRICNSSTDHNESTSESDLAMFEDFLHSANSTRHCYCLPECEEESFKIQVPKLLLFTTKHSGDMKYRVV